MRITDHTLAHGNEVTVTTYSTELITTLDIKLGDVTLELFADNKNQLMDLVREMNRQVAAMPDFVSEGDEEHFAIGNPKFGRTATESELDLYRVPVGHDPDLDIR